MSRPTASERRTLAAQLERSPRGVDAIVTRCGHGYPQVISVRPILDGTPFPTTYWLTCPWLVRAVNRLESAGWIGRFEERIARDPAFAAAYQAAHRRAIAARAERLTPTERRMLEELGRLDSLLDRGIGGIADRRRVKCLHMHVAQALAEAAVGVEPGAVNPVGRETLALLQPRDCDPEHRLCADTG